MKHTGYSWKVLSKWGHLLLRPIFRTSPKFLLYLIRIQSRFQWDFTMSNVCLFRTTLSRKYYKNFLKFWTGVLIGGPSCLRDSWCIGNAECSDWNSICYCAGPLTQYGVKNDPMAYCGNGKNVWLLFQSWFIDFKCFALFTS